MIAAMTRIVLSAMAALVLAACGSTHGQVPHPHGYGDRWSPGRAEPTYLPMPGYDYRFRPVAEGMGRDPRAPVHWVEQHRDEDAGGYVEGYRAEGRSHQVTEWQTSEEHWVTGTVYEEAPPPPPPARHERRPESETLFY